MSSEETVIKQAVRSPMKADLWSPDLMEEEFLQECNF